MFFFLSVSICILRKKNTHTKKTRAIFREVEFEHLIFFVFLRAFFFPLFFLNIKKMIVGLRVLFLALMLIAACSARSKQPKIPLEEQLRQLTALPGCWEEIDSKSGVVCRQYFGYSYAGNTTLRLASGFNNYLVVNDAFLQSPVTEFLPDTDDPAQFAVTVPCALPTAYATWNLGATSAHSRIGDITHHCKHVADTSTRELVESKKLKTSQRAIEKTIDRHADNWSTQHQDVHSGDDIGDGFMQFTFSDSSKCARVPELTAITGVDVLGVSLHAPQEICTASGDSTVPVGLRWSVASNCMSLEHETEAFAELRLPCGNFQLLFGLSDSQEYSANTWPATMESPPRGGQIFYAPALSRTLSALMTRVGRQFRHHSADVSLWIEIYDVSTAGRASLDRQLVSGGVLRIHSKEQQSLAALANRDSGAKRDVLIRPTHDCTKVLTSGSCMSWFGYEMSGVYGQVSSIQHRPVGVLNRFSVAPYDRGQITYFKPGVHNYAVMVMWNCTADGAGNMAQLQWLLDGAATATPLGPSCRLGCDGRADSTKQYDDCGVCGGDGSSCADARHEYFVDSRGNTLRKYCDGVNEQRATLDFDNVQAFNTRRGNALNPGAAYHVSISSSKTMVVLNSGMPPRDRLALGTPNAVFEGGNGVGANGAFSNAEPQRMVLAFDSELGSPGCMRFQFEKPSQVHSLTVLNMPSTCKVSESHYIPNFANYDVSALQHEAEERENSYHLSKMQTSRCIGQRHCEEEASYFEKNYYYANESLQQTRSMCFYNYHCSDGNQCTADVCVHGCCMHAEVFGCCSCDDDCADLQLPDSCTENFCCTHNRRCMRRDITNCCQTDDDCIATEADSCLDHFCNNGTQQCNVRGIIGCCHSNSDCAGLFDQSDQCSIPICGIDNTCHMLPKACDSGQCNPATGQCVSATPTPSPTVSASQTPTVSVTPTSSFSSTASMSSTATRTPSQTSSQSGSGTPTPSGTTSVTPSTSHSSTPSVSSSATPTSSFTPTTSATATTSATPTSSATSTMSVTPSSTPSQSATMTPTRTSSQTASITPSTSHSSTPSVSSSSTPTNSFTSTPSATTSNSATPTSSFTPTVSGTPSSSITSSQTPSVSSSATGTQTPTASNTPTASSTASSSVTATRTPSISQSSTGTPTSSGTGTRTPTPSTTPSPCCPPGFKWHPVLMKCYYVGPFSEGDPSVTPSATPSIGSSPSVTPSVTPTMTWWPSETPTPSRTPSSSHLPSCPLGYLFNIQLGICVWIGLKRSDEMPRYALPITHEFNVRSVLLPCVDTPSYSL
jgi:hypothetical protein